MISVGARRNDMTTRIGLRPGRTAVHGARSNAGVRIAPVIVAAAVIVHALAAWLARPTGFLTGQDDAEYAILARSLRSGAYRELHRVGEPIHAQYPPGYPALIASWSAAAGERYDRLVLLNVALSAAMLLVLRRGMRARGFGEVEATGSVVVLAVNPTLVALAGSVRSEPAYLLLGMACLLALARESPSRRALVAAGVLAIAAALTRSIGVTLLAAVGTHWLLEHRWRVVAAFAIATALTVGAWLSWTALAPEQHIGTSYVADLRAGAGSVDWAPGPLHRIPDNVSWYARIGVPWVLAVPTVRGTVLDNAVAIALLGLLGALGVWTLLRRWRPAALYLLFYGGLLAVWLWRLDRFVAGLLPVLVAALLVGGAAAAERMRVRRRWLVPTAVALVLAVGGAVRTGAAVGRAWHCEHGGALPDRSCVTVDQASFFDAIRWTRASAAEDAVFLTAKSAPFWLYTGRRSLSYESASRADPTSLLAYLRAQGADYVLLTALEHGEPSQLAPRLAAICERLELVERFPPNGYLFAVPPQQPPSADGAACAALADYLRANEGRVF
jgi:hypothetical protein